MPRRNGHTSYNERNTRRYNKARGHQSAPKSAHDYEKSVHRLRRSAAAKREQYV